MNVKKRSIVPNTSSRARSFLNFPLGNKRLLVFVLLFMLLSVSLVSARRCEVEGVLHGLRKALYDYYTNPSESSFTPEDLKELLVFYVGIGSDQITVDCTEYGNKIDRASALPDNIPGCSDGTKFGKCSDNKPVYCYAGRLVPRCRLCGCAEGQWCDVTYVYEEKGNKGRWGKCNPGYDVICSVDSDCGVSDYIGGYYCYDGDVYRYYNKYKCLNAGELDSSCVNETMVVLIDDCEVGEECVEGQSSCQTITPPENLTCSDGTAYGVCSITKPKYCENGVLIDKCQVCGCNEDYPCHECQVDGTCEFELIQVTTDTAEQSRPAIYGNKIVWQNYRTGDRDIYMYDLGPDGTYGTADDSGEIKITAEPPGTLTGGLPDIYGNKIVWSHSYADGIAKAGIYMYDLGPDGTYGTADDSGVIKLTNYSTSQAYQWNADIYGDKIVWQDKRNVNYDIYMYDLSTGQEKQITTNTAWQLHPAIYGNKIVWEDSRNGEYDIYMYDLSTGQETQITTDTTAQGYPEIYGDKIVYTDERAGSSNIYMYDLSTKQETWITAARPNQGGARYKPVIYGDKIVWYELYYNGGAHKAIFMYDLSTGQETQITISEKITLPSGWFMGHHENPAIYGDKIVWQTNVWKQTVADDNEDIVMITIC